METRIKTDDGEVWLSNKGLENDSFIRLTMWFGDSEYVHEVTINEFLSALIAFDALRSKRLSLDCQRDCREK